MDFNWSDVDDREKFPPKRIWVLWDASGEFMDETCDPEEAERWIKGSGGHVGVYGLSELHVPPPVDEEYVKRMFPFPGPPRD